MAWIGALAGVALGASVAWAATNLAGGRPDSVLARVEGREITLSGAASAWRATGARAPTDSLTPRGAAEFLDLLIDQTVLTEAARRAGVVWSAEDSVAHARLEDRLTLEMALDSVLAETRASTGADSTLDPLALGVIARDRAIARLDVAFDAAVAGRLAGAFRALPKSSADSSIAAQIRTLSVEPVLDSTDRARPVARLRTSAITAGQIVAAWSRLSVAVRPRVETAEQVEDLARNLLFESALRADAARRRLDRSPSILDAMWQDAERLSLAAYLAREVLGRVTIDSAVVRAWFEHNDSGSVLPLRVRGIRLGFDDRGASERMAARLADAASAESLAAGALRRGVNYAFETDEASDSILFRAAMAAGAGAMFGPIADRGTWWVGRVMAIVPARARRFDEVRLEAEQHWYSLEVERRTHALAGRLRRHMRVWQAPRAAEALAAASRVAAPGEAAAIRP